MMRAILFDFDGVVVQSERLHRKTFLEVLNPMGIDVSLERWFAEFAGTGSRNIFTVLLREAGSDVDVDEYVEIRKKAYGKAVENGELELTDGVREFLETVRGKGIKTAVVSGGHASNIRIVLKKMELEDQFDLVIGAEDVSNRKPHPEAYLKAASMLGAKPEECVGVEDSESGSKAVLKAGMKLVVVRSPAARNLNGYYAIINSFSEFPPELII